MNTSIGSGIIYTQSGNVKKYEKDLLSISPDRVKFVDFDNHSVKPFISWVFTPDNHPSNVSLEEGTAMYVADLRDPDITLENYLTYTPPDGYELVSEDHKYDTGVKEYYVSKDFYCEPFTVYYGTAGKTINNLCLIAGKYFYYKEKKKEDIYIYYYVTFTINDCMVHCKCKGITEIPGTHSGNVTLGVRITLSDKSSSSSSSGLGGRTEDFTFSWLMRDGIHEGKSCSVYNYLGSGFTTRSDWEHDNGDSSRTHYIFEIDNRI